MRNVDTLPTNTYLMFDSPRSPHTTRFGSNGSISSCSSVSAMPQCFGGVTHYIPPEQEAEYEHAINHFAAGYARCV